MIQNSLIKVASFTPNSLQSPSAWVGHLPFAAWLIQRISPNIFVELGTHSGNSYFSFCQSIVEAGISTKSFAVDTWQGDEHAGHYNDDIFAEVNAYHQEHYAGFSRLLRMYFDDAVTYFANESIDLLHIDGLHTYEAVRHDFETWLPKLAPGAVVMFHDTNVRERNFGVWKFWGELQACYPNNLEFLHSHGLGVLQLNNAPHDKKQDWLRADSAEKQIIKNYFNALGSRQLERFELNEQRQQNSHLTHAVAEKEQQISHLTHAVAEKEQQISHLTHAVAEKEQQISHLTHAVAEKEQQNSHLTHAVAEKEQQISHLTHAVAEKEQQISHLTHALALSDFHVQSLLSSTSWAISAPMRFFSRLVRGQDLFLRATLRRQILKIAKHVYWAIPIKYRSQTLLFCYRTLPRLFSGMPHFEQWRHGSNLTHHLEMDSDHLLTLDDVSPANFAEGAIAIHLHLYYEDLAEEFSTYLKNMPFNYDLFVSVTTNEGKKICSDRFSKLPNLEKIFIEIVPNRGRDMAPMFCTFGGALRNYTFLAHLHSKKSLYNNGATDGWRQYLCENLLGSELRIRQIFSLMQSEKTCGIVYPQNYHMMPHWANTWLANRAMGIQWCSRLGISNIPATYFEYPVGSMFWARSSALKPLFDAHITLDDFDEESGQKDGTFAHCLERLLVLTSQSQGFKPRIIKDQQFPSWSSWRLDQCLGNPTIYYQERFNAPNVKLIGFDIFDTLLIRPLIDPESIKKIVARRVGGEAANLYLQYRSIAESTARRKASGDVGLDAIYAQLQELSGMSDEEIEHLKILEKNIEHESVSARTGGLELYKEALQSGKPVVLISDMFLPKNQIANSLECNGINGWASLFVSSEIGVRKDCGRLYDFVLSNYGISPQQFLMVGDNERSDIQIPADMGAGFIPILRPTDLARGLPLLGALIERLERHGTLDDQLSLGLVLKKQFSDISYSYFNPLLPFGVKPFNIGYSILGPILLGFSNWLLERSSTNNITRLYFLAREGELLKIVYDIWTKSLANVAESHYLVVSRRSVSVAALSSFDDILKIASATYYPNTISNFLFERYGLSLSNLRWNQVTDQTGWKKDQKVEIKQGNVEDIRELIEFLSDEIINSAAAERAAMQGYLSKLGLHNDGFQAVVDVGYGATIQNYLNSLVSPEVHGFYLMTDERSIPVSSRHQVLVEGCYYEKIPCIPNGPLMYRYSFELEKMMSSSSPQIINYIEDNGDFRGVYRDLSSEEKMSKSTRNDIQAGVIRYVEDAVHLRDSLLPDFAPSIVVAKHLYESFIQQSSSPEVLNFFKQISLDDHYSGRGVVS